MTEGQGPAATPGTAASSQASRAWGTLGGMRTLLPVGMCLGCVVACATPTGREARSSELASSDDSKNAEDAEGLDDDGSDDPIPLEALASEPRSSPAQAWSSTTVDIGEWCAEREIAANVQAERCSPAGLGPRPEDTLWCFRREEKDDYRVVFFARLHQAEGKALRRLIELPYAAASRPLEGRESSPDYYVRLLAVTADDGQSFELRDDPELDCATAEERVGNTFHDNPEARQAIRPVVERVCRSRGKYSARGQRLQ